MKSAVDIRTFALRRARRILPPYYIAALLLACLEIAIAHRPGGGWDWHVAFSYGYKDLFAHLLMVFNLSPRTIASISPAFWSIALETQLYVIFPLLVVIMARRGIRVTLIATLSVSILWQMYSFHHLEGQRLTLVYNALDSVWYHALPARAFEFAAGMVAAVFVARPRPIQRWVALALILIPLLPALYFILEISRYGPLLDQTWGVIFAASLVLMSYVPDQCFQRNRCFKALVWLGTISYSVYLLHFPVIEIVTPALMHLSNSEVILVGWLRLPLLILVGYLFHLIFERPFMPGKPKIERRAEVAAAVSPAP